jgi:hypothetical protein
MEVNQHGVMYGPTHLVIPTGEIHTQTQAGAIKEQ